MNNLNSWETRLASWKPRRPSAKLEARIFDKADAPPPESHFGSWRLEFRHAAGLAAACLALLMAVSPGGRWLGRRTLATDGFPMLAVWSNQSAAACLTLAYAPHNNWSAPILSWTNQGNIPSSIRSLEPLNTNRLFR